MIPRIHGTLKFLNELENINYIFDLGTNSGDEAVIFAKYFPNAKIIGIEANSKLIPNIRNNIKGYSNIEIFNFGVSDKNEELDFYISRTDNTGTSSFLHKSGLYDHIEPMQFHNPIKLKVRKLSDFIKENKIPKIDILWMDIQGFEEKAFDGLEEYKNDIKIICSEVCYKEIYSGQSLFNDFNKKLVNHGYRCIYNDIKHQNFWGDAIYINTRIPNSENVKSNLNCQGYQKFI